MTPATSRELENIAGRFLEDRINGPHEIGRRPWPVHARGVYIVFDVWDACVYVGKVCSDLDSRRLESRFGEHLADPTKFDTWHHFYVLPMKPGASNAQVEKTEGWVAQHMQPSGSKRSPNPGRRRSGR